MHKISMEKAFTFAIGFVPFLIPSINPEPQTFWSEISAAIIFSLLILCCTSPTNPKSRNTLS